jgi:hypothetical protein
MPYVPPKSLQYKEKEVEAPFKARVHLDKAEEVKEPHFKYLELWKGFEVLYRDQQKGSDKLLATRAGTRSSTEMDLVGSLLTTLSKPRITQVLAHAEIGLLHAALSRRNMKRILTENELLCDVGMTEQEWQLARRDLQFNLQANYWKAAGALGRMLLVVRGAADPKVRKTDNVVSDVQVLGYAYNILRFAMRHLTEQYAETHADFMGVGERERKAQADRDKRMPKPAPPPAAKGRKA